MQVIREVKDSFRLLVIPIQVSPVLLRAPWQLVKHEPFGALV